ncbi:radical SAM protein, partial [bacterium]|nr:radical SAM protein [bacterium]
QTLEDWTSDFCKNSMIPCLKPSHVDKTRNFEYVLNACYPTQTYLQLAELGKKAMKFLSSLLNKLLHCPD